MTGFKGAAPGGHISHSLHPARRTAPSWSGRARCRRRSPGSAFLEEIGSEHFTDLPFQSGCRL